MPPIRLIYYCSTSLRSYAGRKLFFLFKPSCVAETSASAAPAALNQQGSLIGRCLGVSELSRESVRAFVGGSWIVLGNLSVSLTGLLFWLIMPRLIGLRNLGEASEIISAAMLATTLVSAGLPLAVIREVAELREDGYMAAAIAGSGLAVLGGGLATGLASLLGYQGYSLFSFLLAFLSVSSMPLIQGLVGLERYNAYFRALLTGSLAKLFLGALLAVLGYGLAAALAGYIVHPLVLLVFAAAVLLRLGRKASLARSVRYVKRVLGLTASNYPQAVSLQLMSVLSIYLFALIVGKPVNTGALYISLMAVLALSMIPNALMTAALPISVESGKEAVIGDQLRIGLGLSTPIVAFFVAAPRFTLRLVKPELADLAGTAFLVMLLSVVPLVAVQAAVNILNKRRDERGLVVIGAIRLAVLVSAIIVLARPLGLNGAALAFLLANLAALPLALYILGTGSRIVLATWGLQLLFAPTYLLGLGPLAELLAGFIAATISATAIHVLSILRREEAIRLVRLFANSLFYAKRGAKR